MSLIDNSKLEMYTPGKCPTEAKKLNKHQWFLDKYYKLLHPHRGNTMAAAMFFAYNRDVKTIVETGTTRKFSWEGDGMSTYLFGDYCETLGNSQTKVWTCDISKENIQMCKEITKRFEKYISYHVQDSVEFLRNFDQPIDLLYLDSFDVLPGLEQESAEHNFNEYKAAEPYLHDLSIIVIDDYSVEKPGKGRITVPHLISKGWLPVFDQRDENRNKIYQAVFIKGQ